MKCCRIREVGPPRGGLGVIPVGIEKGEAVFEMPARRSEVAQIQMELADHEMRMSDGMRVSKAFGETQSLLGGW